MFKLSIPIITIPGVKKDESIKTSQATEWDSTCVGFPPGLASPPNTATGRKEEMQPNLYFSSPLPRWSSLARDSQ